MILAQPPAGPEVVADLASAAGWALPRRVAVAVVGERPAADASTSPALPPSALIDWSRREPCVLIPDPDGPGRLPRIERALLGWEAVLGPVFPLARAATSLRWARLALGLQAEDLFGDQLRDPDRRFELEIALRARHILRRPGS